MYTNFIIYLLIVLHFIQKDTSNMIVDRLLWNTHQS